VLVDGQRERLEVLLNRQRLAVLIERQREAGCAT